MANVLPASVDIRKLIKLGVKYTTTLTKREAVGTARYLNTAYHSLNNSPVPDEVFDALIDSIRDRWPDEPILKEVGAKVVKRNGVKEVALPVPMPSMDKIKPYTGSVDKFAEGGGSYVISDKLDGISLQLLYDNGLIKKAYTRGNGIRGQDVSGVIEALRVPKVIPIKEKFIVRLEFIVSKKHFKENFSKHEGKGEFATGRNMGGGLLTRNKPSEQVSAFHCVAYDIVGGKGYSEKISNKLSILKNLGFSVVQHKKITGALTDERLVELYNLRKQKSIYDIDGIIVAKDIPAKPTKENPKHAKAFKMNSLLDSQIVEVKEVEWNKSRHGKWIPRIRIDPINLGGVEVQYFTGHNAYYITNGFIYQDRDKHLPVRPINVGAKIKVLRSGDVIPYIVEVVKPARKPSVPKGEYKLDANGVHYIAETEGDDDVEVKQIIHFFNSMEIEGVKEGVVRKLREAGLTTVKDIINATTEDFVNIEGFQRKSAVNLENNIKKGLREATFVRAGKASGVFGDKIGERKLQEVVDHYPDIMNMAKIPRKELAAKIREVRSFANLADQIAVGLPKFVKFVKEHNIKLNKEKGPSSGRLSNLSVLFTSIRDAELAAAIKDSGGKLATTVKQANVLVTKEGASNNKIELAERLGIPIMTIDQFRRKYKL